MTVKVFRKSTPTLEAIQYDGRNGMEVLEFTGHQIEMFVNPPPEDIKLYIESSVSDLAANPKDWVVKDINGSLSVYDDDTFQSIFEGASVVYRLADGAIYPKCSFCGYEVHTLDWVTRDGEEKLFCSWNCRERDKKR